MKVTELHEKAVSLYWEYGLFQEFKITVRDDFLSNFAHNQITLRLTVQGKYSIETAIRLDLPYNFDWDQDLKQILQRADQKIIELIRKRGDRLTVHELIGAE